MKKNVKSVEILARKKYGVQSVVNCKLSENFSTVTLVECMEIDYLDCKIYGIVRESGFFNDHGKL